MKSYCAWLKSPGRSNVAGENAGLKANAWGQLGLEKETPTLSPAHLYLPFRFRFSSRRFFLAARRSSLRFLPGLFGSTRQKCAARPSRHSIGPKRGRIDPATPFPIVSVTRRRAFLLRELS